MLAFQLPVSRLMTVETVRHRSYGTKTCLASAEKAQENLDEIDTLNASWTVRVSTDGCE